MDEEIGETSLGNDLPNHRTVADSSKTPRNYQNRMLPGCLKFQYKKPEDSEVDKLFPRQFRKDSS